MACKRCEADLKPEWTGPGGGSRECAFDEDGSFKTSNWNCGTIEALFDLGLEPDGDPIFGMDESMEIIRVSDGVEFPEPPDYDPDHYVQAGWIILNRYKRRGRTTSAMHVGDFWPAQPLTLATAEAVLEFARPRPVQVDGEEQ